MLSYSGARCLPALTDPVEVTALLCWLAAARSRRGEEEEEEEGRKPISGSGETPHRAGALRAGPAGVAGHGASITERETAALPNDLVLVHRGDAAVGSEHRDGLEYVLAEERLGGLEKRRLWGNLSIGMHA